MDCSENQYYDSGGCHTCVQCPPGQELSEDCGYGYGVRARCQPCGARWFKEASGSHPCQMCQACRRVNRRELSSCTPTRNAMCGECLPGYYSKRRLDGQEDLECMPCGSPPFRDASCGRSRGVDVEKVRTPETMLQSVSTLTASICVTVVVMVILLSVLLFVYHRYTLLRRIFKGCLIPHCQSNDPEVPTVSTATQCPLTQEEKEEVSELMPTQESSDSERGSSSSEKDHSFPVTPAVLCDQGGRVSCPLRHSVCSDCSSGFASQSSSGLPTPPAAMGLLAAPLFATEEQHCASEEGSGGPQQTQRQQWHVPVECTELDIHESFPPGEMMELQAYTRLRPETALTRDNEPSLDIYSARPSGNNLEPNLALKSRSREMSDIDNLVQRSHSIMQGVPLKDLPLSLVRSLAQRLDPLFPGVQSYQQVAHCLGVPPEITQELQGFQHVFHYLSSCTLLSVADLLTTLHQLQRVDSLVLLCEHWTHQSPDVTEAS